VTKNNKKKIAIVSILLCICAATIGFYMYNRGPLDVKNSYAIKKEAALLYDAYNADTSIAQKKYSGKIVQVSGVVSQVADNQQGEMIVLLKTNLEGAYVNCTMQQKTTGIKTNDAVQIKGICSGMGQADSDLGIKGDLYLTRSLIVE
jgi:hypothetical protein